MERFYTCIFLKIMESSLARDWQARHIFEDMLKLSTSGIVDMTRDAIARRTNVPQEVVDRAIQILESPDPESRDRTMEGRRIVRLDGHRDWGWMIVNWEKYEVIRRREERKEMNVARMRKLRAESPEEDKAECAQTSDVHICAQTSDLRTEVHACAPLSPSFSPPASPSLPPHPPLNPSLSPSSSNPTLVTFLQINANKVPILQVPECLSCDEFSKTWNEWVEYRMTCKVKPKQPQRMFQKQLDWLATFPLPDAVEILNQSIRGNYQGLFPPNDKRSNGNRIPGSVSTTELIIRQKELDACNQEIARILNGYEGHQSMTDEDAEKLKPLRARRKELKAILGIQV